MSHDIKSAQRPAPDALLATIADYALSYRIESPLAYETAAYCLMDTLACGLLALKYPACTKLLGPVVPGATLSGGARVPGTSYELDPVNAAFNIGAMIRWLDFNDTWLAAEWGHPSDNLGGVLAVADYLSRGGSALHVRDVLTAMIKAHEIQGVLALENSFNRVGLDHVLLVRVASTAVVTAMLGGTREQIVDAVSNAWVDGGALRTYRHAPNTGSRKSWAAGDATSRAVRHALFALKGEMGYPSALSAKTWGFEDVLFKGKELLLPQRLSSYVMENILFKISFPAEFHAQTAVEAAMALHPEVRDRLDQVSRVIIETQEPGVRIIDKTGPLANPADRDHCIQYMVAIPLLFGRLTAADYEDAVASDPRIDALRTLTEVRETRRSPGSTTRPTSATSEMPCRCASRTAAPAPASRSTIPSAIASAVTRACRSSSRKFEASVAAHFGPKQTEAIKRMFANRSALEEMPVRDFMAQLVSAA